jgi:uncharacterized protein (TIGR03083 family)
MDTWEAIRAERAALVDALAALPAEEWDRPSLCAGWRIREVVAHLISTAQLTPPAFFGNLIASGFRFPVMVARNNARILDGRSTTELVSAYRSRVDARTGPPGPAMSWLGETIVHGEDVFRALGGYRDHPIAHVRAVAGFYAGSNLLIAKNRIAGVKLTATDTDWSHGDGPEATGPALALVLAMTGRASALDDLAGPGVEILRGRCA